MKIKIIIMVLLTFCTVTMSSCSNVKDENIVNKNQINKIDKKIYSMKVSNVNQIKLDKDRPMEIIMVSDSNNKDDNLEVVAVPKGKSIKDIYYSYTEIAKDFNFVDCDKEIIRIAVDSYDFERINQSFVLRNSKENYKDILVVYE